MIRAEDLSVHFPHGFRRRPIKALDHLNLEVREGDFFALLGQNGAGKSTAMYCLLGLLRPTEGRVTLFGHPPEPGSPVFAHVAYLPEEPCYHDYLTVEEALRYYAALYGGGATPAALSDLLERLQLAAFRKLPLRKCSKGMKQKVGIAACLVRDVKVLFLDEPMRGLDPMAVKEFRDILIEKNRRGVTIVMNSHILSEVEMVANRAAILDRGRVVVEDEIRNLLKVDSAIYDVEVQEDPGLPPFFVRERLDGGVVCGTVPADRLFDLMDAVRAKGLQVRSCALRQASLEESFLSILQSQAPHA